MTPFRRSGPDGARTYPTPDGEFVSVTTFLRVVAKPALVPWAAGAERELVLRTAAGLYEGMRGVPPMPTSAYLDSLRARLPRGYACDQLLRDASDIGSAVHERVEWELRSELGQVQGPRPELQGRAAHAFEAWRRWRDSVHLRPIHVEQVVWSATHGFAGTLDLYAELEVYGLGRVRAVLDWKTGKRVYWEAKLQIASYGRALVEMGHASDPLHGLILRFPKTDADPDFNGPCVVEPAAMAHHFEGAMHALQLWRRQQEETVVDIRTKQPVQQPPAPPSSAPVTFNFAR
jgi:hypothetical protein